MATTNPPYRKQTPYHLKLDTAVNQLIALWTRPQSVVASKVDLVGFIQCKQFVVKFTLQCGCRVSFKYFVGLFVVNKRVHFAVVVCLVHSNSRPSLVCGQYDYVLVCFQSFKYFLFVRSQITVR